MKLREQFPEAFIRVEIGLSMLPCSEFRFEHKAQAIPDPWPEPQEYLFNCSGTLEEIEAEVEAKYGKAE